MILKKLKLHNFRNFKDKDFTFSPFLTLVIGENSKGKTNLLEALYFLTFGFGFRETKEIELLNFESKDHSFVEGIFNQGEKEIKFKILLMSNNSFVKKAYFINNLKAKHFNYLRDQTKAVLFTPQQLEIITGSPSRRRAYFDILLSSYDFEYKKRLNNYENALRKRNKILERSKYIENIESEISFWNNFLIEQAKYITSKREEYIKFINNNNKIDSKEFKIKHNKNEFIKEKLQEYKDIELRIKKTLIGPQKDDFQIFIKNTITKDVQKFGSRSEQRLSILWLKMNEILFYEKNYNKKPILLFDDVFSEFDYKNKKLVINLFKKYQTITTTTDIGILQLAEIPKSIIKLS
jgi:DNA replication and repair protein RecF